MAGSARTCFLAMMLGEALVLAVLLLAGRLGFSDGRPYFGAFQGPLEEPGSSLGFTESLLPAALVFGVLLLWSGLWAFPRDAWPYSRRLRTGGLFGLLPTMAVCLLHPSFALEGFVRFSSSRTNVVDLVSLLALSAWLMVHPLALARATRQSGPSALSTAWMLAVLAPALAVLVWRIEPGLLWPAGLAFLALRLGLAAWTAFEWRAHPTVLPMRVPGPGRAPELPGARARTSLFAMLLFEALLLGLLVLDPWMSSVDLERTLASLRGEPFATNTAYELLERFRMPALAVGMLLLWIAVRTFPKEAWPHGKRSRRVLLASLLVLFALLSTEPVWDTDGGVIYFLCNVVGVISLFTVIGWLMLHPVHLARETKHRGQSSLSIGWAVVALMTVPTVLFSVMLDDSAALTLLGCAAIVSLTGRIGLGTATALAWRSSPAAGAAS